MIPKKIHYVWLGGAAKPHLVNMCILSWKDKLPDYEIVEWNEENFPLTEEFRNCPYLEKCYKRKLWAFVSDYMRVHVLQNVGGIYLDTDMYIVKNLDPLLTNDCFMGFESPRMVNLAIAASPAGHPLWKDLLQFYHQEIFLSKLHTVPDIATEILMRNYSLIQNGSEQILKDNIHIYPKEYFYPYYYNESFTPACVKSDTYGIHWWSSSWKSRKAKMFLRTKHLTGWRKWLGCLKVYLRF